MASAVEPESFKRRLLHVGSIPRHKWTCELLCDYFMKIIEGNTIYQCRIVPVSNTKKKDRCFAILTFTMASSVDQCLAKRDQIKREHGFTVQRIVQEIDHKERKISQHIVIQLSTSDPMFNEVNIRDYFGSYGSIRQLNFFGNNRKCLLSFDDYDSVDRLLLDKPHYLNNCPLIIHKCYRPNNVVSMPTSCCCRHRHLVDQVHDLETMLQRLRFSEENKLAKQMEHIKKELTEADEQYFDSMKSFILLERHHRDMKRDITQLCQINQQLQHQIGETGEKNIHAIDHFEKQLIQQQAKNSSLRDAIEYLTENG